MGLWTMSTFIIGYTSFLILAWGWCLYELVHAPTDKELWGEDKDS